MQWPASITGMSSRLYQLSEFQAASAAVAGAGEPRARRFRPGPVLEFYDSRGADVWSALPAVVDSSQVRLDDANGHG